MNWLASRRWRIFLIAWIVYSVHFATNVVREHYPAFSIAQHGTFTVDEYQGFHSDIFVGPTGHSVIGNQVFVSVLAAVPLYVFSPVLDALERYSQAKLARGETGPADYRIDKPNRQVFYKLVKERGLDLRFGAATLVTTVFFMAPITAAFLVFFYDVLRRRGLSAGQSTGLTALLGFGTPVFFRTESLNHNMFVMYAMFVAFVLLWSPGGTAPSLSLRRRLLAGFFGGLTLATDYVGVIILPLLYGYFVISRARTATWSVAVRESLALVVGAIPPVLFLLYSQWAMYGNAIYPGQHWMPDQNVYVNQGARGWTLPDPQLFLMNLFDPSFGMYTWGPVLLLALIPTWRYPASSLVLPRPERRFVAMACLLFVLFASMNQYSRLQFNSGFRYLIPLVPLLILAAADHWIRLSRTIRIAIMTGAVLHAWVLAVYREPVQQSWRLFFAEGPQLSWYRVLSLTSDPTNPWFGTWWVPSLILALTLATISGIWRYGSRLEITHGVR